MRPEGYIDPWSFRTSQDSGGKEFSEDETGRTRSVLETTNQLIAETGTEVRETIPRIKLVEYKGQLWSINNRRVIAARLAGKPIRYEKLEATDEVIGRLKRNMSTKDNGITIQVRK